MDVVLLAYYSALIIGASVLGGLIPEWVRLTHQRTELVVSLVAGTMLGVALLHMLPHALAGMTAEPGGAPTADDLVALFRWVLGGFLAMFFIERFFCFHHHDVPEESLPAPDSGAETHLADSAVGCCDHGHSHTDHTPGLTWGGAAMGLTLHSLLAGVALAASVSHAPEGARLAGLGALLAIVLHKPLDAMTIAVLMARGGWSRAARCLVNALFALAVPAGMAVFHAGVAPLEEAGASWPVAAAVAFSAGVFLCVSMSDLLPELHFHHHDRVKLSVALLMGLALADLAGRVESHSHADRAPAETTEPARPSVAN